MRLNRRSFTLTLAVLLLIGAILPLATLQAHSPSQGATVQLSISIPDFNKDLIDKAMADFEAANPGVSVNVISMNPGGIAPAAAGLDAHLDAYKAYVSTADVLYVSTNRLSEEATRAGYFLDLAPLVNEDKNINVDDFYAGVWKSFQWDKGIWALPTSTDIQLMSYDPKAFDDIGLAYPSDAWTVDDLVNAVEKLAQKDANGTVTRFGLEVRGNYAKGILLLSMLGQGLFDANTIPNPPQIDTPASEKLLDAYYQIEKDGLVGNNAPISIMPAFQLAFQRDPSQARVGVLLPGGKAGLDAQGYAVSGATAHPEEAYALARFMTTRVELAGRFNAIPARQSLAGQTQGNGNGGPPRLRITPELQALIDKGLANGIPLSDLRYADYLGLALTNMKAQNLDAKRALQLAESQAVTSLQAADARKGTAVLTVPTPIPTPELAAGKIALNFGMTAFVRQLPNKDKWDKLISEFTAADPQVGRINIDLGFNQVDQAAEKYDCFYIGYNTVPNATLPNLLNLDPFIAADTTFDKSDVVGNIMDQLTRDNKIWALPINIEPSILRYNAVQFDKAGAVAPGLSWTIDAFNDAVKALKVNPADPAPFQSSNAGGTDLLILMAAYGGLPLDYRTSPVTINYTDPKTEDAIRQVLDLAKNGYIAYEELAGTNFRAFAGGRPNTTASIYTDALNAFNARQNLNNQATNDNPYKPTTYPRGTQFSATSYSIGTAYIGSKAQNPEACYRWISAVAHHPELFNSMPARASLINDPTVAANQGPDVTALYNEIDKQLKDPNMISFPSLTTGIANPSGFLIQYWLYQAFDSYVLKNGDLDTGLKDAQDKGKAFQECVAGLPPLDTSSVSAAQEYIKAFGACATKIDPTLKPLFQLVGG